MIWLYTTVEESLSTILYPKQYIHYEIRHHYCRIAVLLALTSVYILAASSCTRFTPLPRTPQDAQAPDTFTLYKETSPAPDRWWNVFNSEELDHLVIQALGSNLTLQQVAARLTQAEMLAQQTGAARLPELNASGDITATRRRITNDVSVNPLDAANQQMTALNTLLSGTIGGASNTLAGDIRTAQSHLHAAETLLAEPPPTSRTATSHSYKFGLSSTYEVDLWGRVHARHQASLIDLESSREDMYGAMLSLTGTVVRQWITILARRQELCLVHKQLELNKISLGLMELRFRNGLATALDIYQQRQIVAQTESLLPALEESLQITQYELAVLLGRAPRDEVQITGDTLPEIGFLPEPGLPADLLARRPDIRSAGLQLHAADWRVSAAKADRLPALRLNASASYGSEEWALLFDNWMASLAAGITGPVFDAGRRKAEVRRTQAIVKERLAVYRQKVLDSVKEVESAMMRETKQQEYVDALEREYNTAQATHEQALQRYKNGIIDYLPVLTALTQLQTVERKVLKAKQIRLEYRIQLYTALGGGWMEEEIHRSKDDK